MKNVPKLLDTLRERFQIKTDSALARWLGVGPSLICRLRAGQPLADRTILRIHERTGIPVKEIRALAS